MEIEASFVIKHLRSVIIHSLDTFNLNNAEFAAERLAAAVPDDPDALYLHALVLYRQGRFKAAFNKCSSSLSEDAEHLGCAYIFARLCLELGKYKEGVFRLINLAQLYNDEANREYDAKMALNDSLQVNGLPFASSWGQHSPPANFCQALRRHSYESNRLIYPESSAIYHLLGDLYKAQGDVKSSILNYTQALRFNAFDFEAFQELAKLGADISVKSLYKNNVNYATATNPQIVRQSESVHRSSEPANSFSNSNTLLSNPFSTTPSQKQPPPDILTPRVGIPSIPDAPLRRTHGIETKDVPQSGMLAPLPRLVDNRTPTSSQRLFSFVKRQTETVHTEPTRNLKRTNLSGLAHTNIDSRGLALEDIEAADAYLRRLYTVFAKLYKCLQRYDCYKAIRILESLPDSERNTPWVLSKLGKLHYEIVNYKQSRQFFVKLRQLDRTRLEDMEYYSTLLWHLHKKVELTYLANELHDIDPNLAITWCVMGNLFSLAREPDEAIKCFSKSLTIDPKFTYAHTLKGHEYFGNDNYEKALECFRHSILLDPRHYNAYYGIGMVHINLGEYQKAEYHFRKAVALNPINIILICCVGMVLEKLGKKTLALRQYELAHKLQPLSALPVFKKAQLLFAMQQFQQALEQFEIVKELAPNEASVHFLLGQLYNIQNDKFQAIKEFTIALNLDPKGNYLIREAMELLREQ